jgi:hypothetical protein
MIEWGESNYGGGLVYPRLESGLKAGELLRPAPNS